MEEYSRAEWDERAREEEQFNAHWRYDAHIAQLVQGELVADAMNTLVNELADMVGLLIAFANAYHALPPRIMARVGPLIEALQDVIAALDAAADGVRIQQEEKGA